MDTQKEKKEKKEKVKKISQKINEKAKTSSKQMTFDWSGVKNDGEPGYRNFDFSDIPGFRD